MADSSESINYKNVAAGYSDATIDVILSSGHSNVSLVLAVAEEKNMRRIKREDLLLAEIKRPHWSITPSFYLLVVSVVLSAAALLVALIGLPQAQQPVTVVAPSVQSNPPAK